MVTMYFVSQKNYRVVVFIIILANMDYMFVFSDHALFEEVLGSSVIV